jgi:tripartite-type tricarboxylate transporter receptor subunit TctC
MLALGRTGAPRAYWAALGFVFCLPPLCALPCTAAAQAYPVKAVRIVAPFPPGGGVDAVARIIADPLAKALGQPVIVENRPGAAGTIGTAIAAKARPDGYTLVHGTVSTHGIAPSLYPDLGYDAEKDFTPLSLTVTQPNVLAVHPSVPARTVAELIRLARSRPGTLSYASSGSGTTQHLSAAMFESMAGVELVHVPYKGSAPALTDLLGGQVQLIFDNLASALPHIQAGKLRALAVTSAKRAAQLPDVPTMQEAGLPGYEVTSWYALFGPAGLPAPVAQRLNTEITRILAQDGVTRRLAEQGFQVAPSTPTQLAAFVHGEVAKWGRVVRQANVSLE